LKAAYVDVDPRIREILAEQGIAALYPPQEKALPAVLGRRNLVLCIPTASGKSLVAYLAILEGLLHGKPGGKALYIVPLRALASEKHDYEDLLGSEDLVEAVRALMEGQHKAMVARLKQGALDPVIAERLTDPAEDTGSGLQDAPPATPAPAVAASPRAAPAPVRAFGDGIVSQKPLDEVILEYLSRKARDRAAERSDASGRKSQTRE